jgi:hypothetical protein
LVHFLLYSFINLKLLVKVLTYLDFRGRVELWIY